MDLPVDYNKIDYKQRKKVRQKYIEIQNNKCYYCNNSLDDLPSENIRSYPITKSLFPKNFFKYPVHLHHDHLTGLTIGAVHNYCNAVLWEYYNE